MSYNLQQDIITTITNSSVSFEQDLNDLVVLYVNGKTISFLREEDKNKDLFVKGDSKSKKLCFIFQKYYEDMDLSTTYPIIIFKNNNQQYQSPKYSHIDRSETGLFTNWCGLTEGTEELENENFIYFIWTVPAEFCLDAGKNILSIVLQNDEVYRFVTKPFEVQIIDTLSLEGMPIIPTEEEVGKIEQLEEELSGLKTVVDNKQNSFNVGYGLELRTEEDETTLSIDMRSEEQDNFYNTYLKQLENLSELLNDYNAIQERYSKINTEGGLLGVFKVFEDKIHTTNVSYINKPDEYVSYGDLEVKF